MKKNNSIFALKQIRNLRFKNYKKINLKDKIVSINKYLLKKVYTFKDIKIIKIFTIEKIQDKFSSINKYLLNYTEAFKGKKLIKSFNIDVMKNNLSSKINKNKKANKKNQRSKSLNFDFVCIHYSDHKLSIAHIVKRERKNLIKDFVKIEVPGDLIGDFNVENKQEVSSIIKDVIEVFGLNNPPLILLLSSSFFTATTFSDSELVVFSESDPTLLSKSPFIPLNTSIQYERVSGDKITSYHRVIYAEKSSISSWMSVLILLNKPIVALTSSSLHIIDHLSGINNDDITVLCDVDHISTTIHIQKKNCELYTFKLPYGSSLYISPDGDIVNQYFIRLKDSLIKLLEKKSFIIPDNFFISGSGLDLLINQDYKMIKGFSRYPINNNKTYELGSDSLKLKEADNFSVMNSLSLMVKEIS